MSEHTDIMAEFVAIPRSPYLRGTVEMVDPPADISSIFIHGTTGQVRIYAASDMDGTSVSVNGAEPVTMKKRGRFGLLYIGQ